MFHHSFQSDPSIYVSSYICVKSLRCLPTFPNCYLASLYQLQYYDHFDSDRKVFKTYDSFKLDFLLCLLTTLFCRVILTPSKRIRKTSLKMSSDISTSTWDSKRSLPCSMWNVFKKLEIWIFEDNSSQGLAIWCSLCLQSKTVFSYALLAAWPALSLTKFIV